VPGCVFCAIVEGRSPAWQVYADDAVIAFMDINPVTDGHTLVVPRAHVRDLWEIGQEEAARTMAAAVRVAAAIRRALAPDGLNLLHATGAAAMQTVFHFHLHLIPRYASDGIRLPFLRRPGDPARLAALADRIRAAEPSPPGA
jgi:histidine triad (HIT) family protein